MANLALIYPDISSEDYQKIQSIRKQHDSRYFDVVEPHITLVFSTDKITADELVTHVGEKLAGIKPFKLTFDSAKAVEDDSKDFYHAFLIPSNGFNEINQIHDELYTGVLKSELRHDIPFIPHLGIGTGSKADIDELVSQLNDSKILIEGIAKKITVVQYDGTLVSNHLSVSLS